MSEQSQAPDAADQARLDSQYFKMVHDAAIGARDSNVRQAEQENQKQKILGDTIRTIREAEGGETSPGLNAVKDQKSESMEAETRARFRAGGMDDKRKAALWDAREHLQQYREGYEQAAIEDAKKAGYNPKFGDNYVEERASAGAHNIIGSEAVAGATISTEESQPDDTPESVETEKVDLSEASRQFIEGLDKRLEGVDGKIDVGEVEGYVDYSGQEPKYDAKSMVLNPGAIRARSWVDEKNSTTKTQVIFGPEAVDMPSNKDGALMLTYEKDEEGHLVKVTANVSHPSQFRSSLGYSVEWEPTKGITGYHNGAGNQVGPMKPEIANRSLNDIVQRFDGLLQEAGK